MPGGIPMAGETLRKYSTWFMVYGVLLILLGFFAIVAPNIATFATAITVGWLLLFGGFFGLVAVIQAGKDSSGFWWNLFTAIIYILAGLSLLVRPLAGILTLTIILAAYLLAGGISRIIMAFGYKREIPKAWPWVLLSGIVDLGLAALIMLGLPGTAIWVIGLMVGINLLMMGVAIVAAAYHCRSATSGTAPRAA